MVRFIHNDVIRAIMGIDDLDIREYASPLQLKKQFSIKDNDIQVTVVFPIYSANEAYTPKTDMHLYELTIDGPIRKDFPFMKKRCNAMEIEKYLQAISDKIRAKGFRPIFTTCEDAGVKKNMKHYNNVLITTTQEDRGRRSVIWANEKKGAYPIIITSFVRQQNLRQDGTFMIETTNDIYYFEML